MRILVGVVKIGMKKEGRKRQRLYNLYTVESSKSEPVVIPRRKFSASL
jgi:hypothetical protein